MAGAYLLLLNKHIRHNKALAMNSICRNALLMPSGRFKEQKRPDWR